MIAIGAESLIRAPSLVIRQYPPKRREEKIKKLEKNVRSKGEREEKMCTERIGCRQGDGRGREMKRKEGRGMVERQYSPGKITRTLYLTVYSPFDSLSLAYRTLHLYSSSLDCVPALL